MIKFLCRRLLIASYCASRKIVHKKKGDRIIPFTLHLFLTPLSFIVSGLCCILLSKISFKMKYPEIIIMAIILLIGYGLQKPVKKAIFKWGIEKEYKTFTKNELWNKYILSFLFFWGSFALFFYLGVKFMEGYSVK